MKKFNTVEMIAFRDRDSENDVWAEMCFLFKSVEDVKSFFTCDNSALLDIYTEEDSRVLYNFEINDSNPAGNITSVSFSTKFAGNVRIYEMSKGFVCIPTEN